MRPEIEKTMLAAGLSPDEDIQKLLSVVTGTVLCINGGVGLVAEYLNDKGCNVTLTDANRLCFSYRRALVPNSTVRHWNIESENIKLNKPSFDYVVIKSSGDFSLAEKLAKKAVVSLYDKKVKNIAGDKDVVNSNTNNSENTEIKPNSISSK